MPLSSQLPLQASPRSATEARRWVAGICRQLDRHDLVECAEIGVSELVANAVLHGSDPIKVRVRGTARNPRIEVHDGSTKAPVLPGEDEDDDDFLATFGRGLAMVARSAVTWGATIESDGKVVWFEPAAEVGEVPAEAVIDDDVQEAGLPVSETAVRVRLKGIDTELYAGLSRQYGELRRELRLLALAHEDAYPLAGDLSAMFANFERQFPVDFGERIRAAAAEGQARLDLEVPMAAEAADVLSTMIEMFDLADAFCRAERLLAIERSPRQRAFHTWLLGEIVRQIGGARPTTWVERPVADEHATQHVS